VPLSVFGPPVTGLYYLEGAGHAVMFRDRDVLAFLEGMIHEAIYGLVVLLAGGIGKCPSTFGQADEFTMLKFSGSPKAEHSAVLLFRLPCLEIDLAVFRQRNDEFIAMVETAFRKIRCPAEFEANTLECRSFLPGCTLRTLTPALGAGIS
jgi:hypothetical protein